MKLVVLDGYTLNPGDLSWKGLEEFGELTVYDRTAPDEVAERIRDADIVLVNKVKLSREALTGAKHLRYITVLATGYDCVDAKAAKDLGIQVSNVPTYGTDSVAQFTLALILELAHQIGRHSEAVQTGAWVDALDWTFNLTPQIELTGKTLGIIGYGRIGQRVGELARAFGMQVITVARPGRSFEVPSVPLEELLRHSDFISLHCPLTPFTKGIIDGKSLAKMKPGAFLINASRGGLIVEEDLRAALDAGTIAGAAVDVVSTEPMAAHHPYLGAKNLIITPHIAWSSKEARIRIMETISHNIHSFLAGDVIHRVI